MALSAPRLKRKTVIKVKIETDKGTKVAGDQALLVFGLEINDTSPYTERKGTGTSRGQENTGVHGEASGVCSFSAELRSNGSNGLEAGLAILLQASVLKKTSETYQVHSTHTDDKTISIDVWEDGKKKGLAGASGNWTLENEDAGGRMMFNFEFYGVWQTPTDEAVPANAPSTAAPMMFKNGTFTLDSNSIKCTRFSLNMGCNVVPRRDVDAASGIAYYMIPDFNPELQMTLEADLVAGYDYHGIKAAGTEKAVSLLLTDGTVNVTITLPKVQTKDLSENEVDGIEMIDFVGQCNDSSGNDSVAITAAAAA